jgi:hypothetical protein
MSSNNPPHSFHKTSTDELLNELESIKDILEEADLDDDLDINIPILEDVIADNNDSASDQPYSLNLSTIFDDEDDSLLSDFKLVVDSAAADSKPQPSFTQTATSDEQPAALFSEVASLSMASSEIDHAATTEALSTSRTNLTDLNLDLLIQEIVDEFIPLIEDQLRQHLAACSPQLIQQLAKKHLKS